MKRRWLWVLLMVLLTAQPAAALTGREIMEKSDALAKPKTTMSKVLMKIYKGGRVDEKVFTLLMKRYPNDEDKAVIAFIRPTRIKLLTHAHKGADDDQWLCLSSGKIKRIAAASKGKPFVNSHFYYEDLTSVDIDDYAFKLLGETTVAGQPCYQVEGIKQKGDKVYDKVVFDVRKSDYFVVRVDFYMDGQFHKYLENDDIKSIDGILTPYRIKMERADGNGKTELYLMGLKYNEKIPDMQFDKEALR